MMNNSNKQTHGSTFNLTHLSNYEFHSFLIWFNCYLTLQTLPVSPSQNSTAFSEKTCSIIIPPSFKHFSYWEGNRQEGQGSPNGGNRLQVSLKILCCHDDTWFHLNLPLFKPGANQCVFLMEMFFLSYVNETTYMIGIAFLQNGST